MTYNDAKKIINKLNARLRTLKANSENSYAHAIEQLKAAGPVLTDSNVISTSQKKLDMAHLDKQIKTLEAAVPTMTEEIKYIERELAPIDKKRLKLYGNAIPTRDKETLLSELNAKRYFDKVMLTNSKGFNATYEAWENKEIIVDMTKELVDLENEINRRLGKGHKAVKSYAELYEIQQLIDDYKEAKLVTSAQPVNNTDMTT